MSRPSLLPRDERRSLLEFRRRHGLTFAEVSRETGIREGTLRAWDLRERVASPPPRFVEVESAESPSELCVFEVEAAGGRRVRVPSGFDAAELRRLLAALEGAC